MLVLDDSYICTQASLTLQEADPRRAGVHLAQERAQQLARQALALQLGDRAALLVQHHDVAEVAVPHARQQGPVGQQAVEARAGLCAPAAPAPQQRVPRGVVRAADVRA